MSCGTVASGLLAPDADEFDLVSFDVFDTLIVRTVGVPTDVFKIVRAKLLKADCTLLDPASINSFPDLRVEAERVARAWKKRDTGCDEVSYDEIYIALAGLAGIEPGMLALLQVTELETEKQVSYANPAAAALLDAARAAGKRIIFCSDMYLSSHAIRDLLRSCGYQGDDPIFVSCEHGRSKYHGTMFSHVAHATGVALERILHIGDNPHGDVLMARNAGCLVQPFPCPAIPSATFMPWTQDGQEASTVSSVVSGLVLRRQRLPGPGDDDPLHDLGFRVFGPLFTGFMLWLRRAVAHEAPDRILLLARDMHWVQAVLPRFLALDGPIPDTRYVHASRASLLIPSMTDFPVHRLQHVWSGRAALSVGARLRHLGVEPAVLLPLIRSAGFASVDEIVAGGDPRMPSLLGKLSHLLLRISAEQRPIVQEYLDPFVVGASDVFLVDVGWAGNMQSSLVRLLGSRHPDLRLRGYYVGAFGSAADNLVPARSMHGWLTQPGNPPSAERVMWETGGVELLEFAMRAPHGTTLGYHRQDDGKVVPTLEADLEEDALSLQAARLQAGALAFIDDFLAIYGTVPADGLDSPAWAAPLFRLVMSPTAAEAELLGDITHSDDAGPSLHRLPLAPRIADPAARADTALRGCYWTTGFLARNDWTSDEAFDEALYVALYPDVGAAYPDGRGHEHWVEFGKAESRIPSWAAWTRHYRQLGQK